MIVKSRNTLAINVPKTFTTHLEAASVSVLRWKNPNGFIKSWGVQVGETGEEQTEVLILSTDTVAGTAGTFTANTLYEHPANTPLYAIRYDKVVFERSDTGTAGDATPITNGTITYQADNEFTQFDDPSGTPAHAYKTLFRASVLGENSIESDFITSAGFSFYSLSSMRQRVRDKLWNAEFIKDDIVIDNWVNEWKEEMINSAIDVNEDYSLGTVDVAFGTSGLGTITESDFKQMRRVWITYNGADYFRAQKKEQTQFLPNEIFNSTHPVFYMQGDDVFGVEPKGLGTARIVYYSLGTTLVNDTDELPLSMRGYTKSFVEYGQIQAQYKDNKMTILEKKAAEVGLKDEFKKQLVPRNKTGQTMVDIVESFDENIIF